MPSVNEYVLCFCFVYKNCFYGVLLIMGDNYGNEVSRKFLRSCTRNEVSIRSRFRLQSPRSSVSRVNRARSLALSCSKATR